jgi:hypothetical protein
MFATRGEPEPEDLGAALAALERLHVRLRTTAEALRSDLARPPATWTVARAPGQGAVRLGPGRLPEAERAALYECLCTDLQMLEQLTGLLKQLRVTIERAMPPGRASCE